MKNNVFKNFIVGLGTGRCGTQSLSQLLSAQEHCSVPHEFGVPLPWSFSLSAITQRIEELKFYNGDIAFYYLNYVNYLLKKIPNIRFVCLQRDRNDTIESYLIKSEDRNNWIDHDESVWSKSPLFYNSYPKFNVETKREALEAYYDQYYGLAQQMEEELPGIFKIFPMQFLNEEEGVIQILSHCGFKKEEMRLKIKCHYNQNKL